MTFDPTKPVRTRDGHKVRIVDTNYKDGEFCIVAIIEDLDDDLEAVETFTKEGCFNGCGEEESLYDLINVPETTSYWINIYPDGPGIDTESKEQSDAFADPTGERIALLEIRITGDNAIAVMHEA